MRLASLLFLMGVAGVAGYEVCNHNLDGQALRALEAAWEKRIRKDAQIIRAELSADSYERSILNRNQELNGLADPSTPSRMGVNTAGRIPAYPGSPEKV